MGFAVVDGKVFDHKSKTLDIRNMMIKGEKIVGVGYIPDEDEEDIEIIDAKNAIIVPNTFDFMPTPKIDVLSDFLSLCHAQGIFQLMLTPSNDVSLDTPEDVAAMAAALGENSQVALAASVTTQQTPTTLAELSLMIKAGATALYFDRIIEQEDLLKQALIYVDMIGCPIIFGPLTTMDTSQAHLNAGQTSFEIGVKGESEHHELMMIKHVLGMVKQHTSVPIHFHAVSSADGVRAIHEFKASYSNSITVGVSPFHLMISDQLLTDYNPKLKFNPPFRHSSTMIALQKLLKDGHIDHFPSLNVPDTGDKHPMPFYNQLFGTVTLDHYFKAVSHNIVGLSLNKNTYYQLLNAPISISGVQSNKLLLNSEATFVIFKLPSQKQETLFGSVEIDMHFGDVLSVYKGEIQ